MGIGGVRIRLIRCRIPWARRVSMHCTNGPLDAVRSPQIRFRLGRPRRCSPDARRQRPPSIVVDQSIRRGLVPVTLRTWGCSVRRTKVGAARRGDATPLPLYPEGRFLPLCMRSTPSYRLVSQERSQQTRGEGLERFALSRGGRTAGGTGAEAGRESAAPRSSHRIMFDQRLGAEQRLATIRWPSRAIFQLSPNSSDSSTRALRTRSDHRRLPGLSIG